MQKRTVIGVVLAFFVATGPAVAGAGDSTTVVASFNPALGQLPESVTTDGSGNFFLSMSNTVQKLAPDGTLSLYAQLPIPAGAFALGVKFGPDGALYVASGGFSPLQDASYVFRIPAAGSVGVVAHLDANGFPNDLAFDDAGDLYVTDPFLGQLWRIDAAGQATVWLADPLLAGNPGAPALLVHFFGADGITFDRQKRNLYVGNIDSGAIVRVPLRSDGSAGAPAVFVQDPRLLGCDGIVFDRDDNLWVAVNGQDQIARVDANAHVAVVAGGAAFDSPSALVFGARGNDKKNLYVANFAILRAFGAKPGPPNPGLLRLTIDDDQAQ